jgi:D-methionine transport system substrate-binding protein
MKLSNRIAALALAAALVGTALAQEKPLKVGVTAGPHAQILEVVKKVAERDGLKLQIVEFNDYVQPNAALANGDLDINSYQHQPYLDNTVKDRGYKLVSIAQTVTFPIGLYSKRFKSLDQIPTGGRIAIPNDPTNGGRALLLLADKGVIKLKPDAGLKATPIDVIDNPKKLKIIELDAAQLPRSLDEVDAAAVNTNYALPAGLVPTRDAIALENPRSPYANVIAVRAQDKDNPAFKKFVKAYHTDEVKQFVAKEFKGSVIPAW